jgi:hypothetical protein
MTMAELDVVDLQVYEQQLERLKEVHRSVYTSFFIPPRISS